MTRVAVNSAAFPFHCENNSYIINTSSWVDFFQIALIIM